MDTISTVWARIGAAGGILAAPPDPGTGTPPAGIGPKVDGLLSNLAWLAVAACVAGILLTALRMAVDHRRGNDNHMAQLGAVLGACVLIGSASGLVANFL